MSYVFLGLMEDAGSLVLIALLSYGMADGFLRQQEKGVK